LNQPVIPGLALHKQREEKGTQVGEPRNFAKLSPRKISSVGVRHWRLGPLPLALRTRPGMTSFFENRFRVKDIP
jgi:hypothetical protein